MTAPRTSPSDRPLIRRATVGEAPLCRCGLRLQWVAVLEDGRLIFYFCNVCDRPH